MRKGGRRLFREFTSSEKNAGLVLLFCAVVSMILSNLKSTESYSHFWHMHVGASIGLDLSLEAWINDALMTIFFLMVGLEIERELYDGELNPIKNAILPIGAALGGMCIPALIYSVINFDSETIKGFGIPMGTDIAFALGILSLAGNRVPIALKVLLTAIAIIDDLGSIFVIAFFYGSGIEWGFLSASLAIFLFLILLNRLKVFSLFPYLLLGIPMWYCMLRSGIHPTISGVLLAFALPFGDGAKTSPSLKLQHMLHLPVAFIILPIFTLANTAIPIRSEYISGLLDEHAIGIGFGLILGKPIGIITAAFLLVKFKLVTLPKGVSWYDVTALGFIAGIGFTMSIFITQLAFTEEVYIQSSKLMILMASTIAGCIGLAFFRWKKVVARPFRKT